MEVSKAPRLLSIGAVKNRTSLSYSTIHRLVEREQFPRPIKITRGRLAWIEPAVEAWIISKLEAA